MSGAPSKNNPALVSEQYKTKDNLQVRIDTHQKYTVPEIDYISSMLDHINWSGNETVIDVGCGAGAYVAGTTHRSRLYIAGDLSLGMLRSLTAPTPPRVNLDAQQLPFASQSADVVLANHMLYHVPDQDAAVSEIKRLLKPGGFLLAATNSETNMKEMTVLRIAIGRHFGIQTYSELIQPTLSFTLESGYKLLGRHFSSVSRHDQPSALVFPTSQPVVDYINSSRSYYQNQIPTDFSWQEMEAIIHQTVNAQIAEKGEFRVSKLMGIFVCQKEL